MRPWWLVMSVPNFLASWVSLCPLPLHPHGQPTGLWPQWYCSLLLGQLALPEALLWRHLHPGAAGFRAILISVAGLTGTDLNFLYLHSFHCSQGPHNSWVKESILHLCFTPYSGDHLSQQFHFSRHPSARDSVHAVQQRGLGPELYHHAPPETGHLQSLQWEGEVSPERCPQVELTHGCKTPWGSHVKGYIPTRLGKYLKFRSHRQYLVLFSDNEIGLHKYAMWRSAFTFLPQIFLMPPASHRESWSIWISNLWWWHVSFEVLKHLASIHGGCSSFSSHVCASVQFSSVAQSCLTLCNPMNRSTPGLPVHHQFPESTHWVGDAIQPSHPLSSPSPPALNLSQHQGLFKWVSSSHQVAKVLDTTERLNWRATHCSKFQILSLPCGQLQP